MKCASGPPKTIKRAYQLVDILLQEMHAGLKDPARLSTDEWDKLFGAKQSMIANLQKLVSTLAALPVSIQPVSQGEIAHPSELSTTEMAMLKAWLEEGER